MPKPTELNVVEGADFSALHRCLSQLKWLALLEESDMQAEVFTRVWLQINIEGIDYGKQIEK